MSSDLKRLVSGLTRLWHDPLAHKRPLVSPVAHHDTGHHAAQYSAVQRSIAQHSAPSHGRSPSSCACPVIRHLARAYSNLALCLFHELFFHSASSSPSGPHPCSEPSTLAKSSTYLVGLIQVCRGTANNRTSAKCRCIHHQQDQPTASPSSLLSPTYHIPLDPESQTALFSPELLPGLRRLAHFIDARPSRR